jgi:y4mF family transcriptional regulator
MEWDRENTLAQFVRERRKKVKLIQVELSDFTGVGLRFVRELEQGKPNLMSDKVNQVLLFFGHINTNSYKRRDKEKYE